MATTHDYYRILGLDPSATPLEVRRAFRRLAHRYHPDHNPGDRLAAERFKEVLEAYEVLSNPGRRRSYDAAAPGQKRSHPDAESSVHRSAGRDRHQRISVTLQEASRGASRRILVDRVLTCSACAGRGHGPCPTCGGSGMLYRLWTRQACSVCAGSGFLPGTCRACAGRGLAEQTKVIWLQIPAGVDEGAKIRLAGEGDVLEPGGRSGDLYLHVRMEPHPDLYRSGRDVSCWIDLDLAKAALGGKVEIPTLAGPRLIELPPGVRHGTAIRLDGWGMPDLRTGERGVQWVFCRVSAVELEQMNPLKRGWLRLRGWTEPELRKLVT